MDSFVEAKTGEVNLQLNEKYEKITCLVKVNRGSMYFIYNKQQLSWSSIPYPDYQEIIVKYNENQYINNNFPYNLLDGEYYYEFYNMNFVKNERPVKENLTNLQLPFQETYQKGFLYYYNDIEHNIQQLLERDTDNLGKNNQFIDAISETQNFSPLGQNSGFLAFGGYNLGRLPQRGELGNVSDDFSIEDEVLYLNTTRKDKTVPSWIRMDLTEGTFYDIIYGDSLGDKKDPAFEITEEEINNETVTYIILNKTDWFININTEIFSEEKTGDGSTRSFIMNDSLVGKITSVRYQQQLSIPSNQYEYNINTKTITFTFVPQNNAPITIYYIKKERLLDFIEKNNGQYINRLSDVSYSAAQDCLDIPEKINNLNIQELQLESGLEYTNQVIVPTQDLFIFGKNNFLTHDSYTELRMIRNKPEVRYNLQENSMISLDNDDISDNIFVLSKDSLKNGRFTNLDELYQSYPTIYYGIGCLSGSRFRYFNLRNTDKYPNDNLNFAIVNTPSLQGYIGSLTETESGNSVVYSDSGEGVLINNNEDSIKSFSSKYILNKINADNERDANTIKISDLRAASNINGPVNIESYALLSAQDIIHTLIIDNTNNISLAENSLNLDKDSKLQTVVVDSPCNNISLSLTNSASLKINTFDANSTDLFLQPFNILKITYGFPLIEDSELQTLVINETYKELYIQTTYAAAYQVNGTTKYGTVQCYKDFDIRGELLNILDFSGKVDEKTDTLKTIKTKVLNLSNCKYNFTNSSEILTEKFITDPNTFSDFMGTLLDDHLVGGATTASIQNIQELVIEGINGAVGELNTVRAYMLINLKKLNICYSDIYETFSQEDFNKLNIYYEKEYAGRYIPIIPNEMNIWTDKIYRKRKYNGEEIGFYTINANAFRNLPKLQEIYLPEEIIYKNNIGNYAFYKNSPITIYVYIWQEKNYLKQDITLDKYREDIWKKKEGYAGVDSFNDPENNTIFPNDSVIKFINLNENENSLYRIKTVGKYIANKTPSKIIQILETWNYQDIEGWTGNDNINADNSLSYQIFHGDGETNNFVIDKPIGSIQVIRVYLNNNWLESQYYNVDYNTNTVTFLSMPPLQGTEITILYNNI